MNASARPGEGKPLPQARVRLTGEGAKMAYEYYPTRDMILDEFDQIWAKQSEFHDCMTEAAKAAIRGIIEWQRPLKSPGVGKCSLIEGEPRAPKALPSAQYARVLQEVNNLRIRVTGEPDRLLDTEQQRLLIDSLLQPTSKTSRRTFEQLRRILKLSESRYFNTESLRRDYLEGDITAAVLMQKDSWGPSWFDLPRNTQDAIVMKLINTQSEDELVAWLHEKHGVDSERAKAAARTALPDAHGSLSAKALAALIPHLEKGLSYYDAVQATGLRTDKHDRVIHDEALPYYGEVLSKHTAFEKPAPTHGPDNRNIEEKTGKIANPTVHVALNEIRKLINHIMADYGPPEQVVMEMARDLPLSARGKSELESRQAKNQKENERRTKLLIEGFNEADNYANRLKLRLWEEMPELSRACVFTGRKINKTNLFSAEVEFEHILPIARTLDDSYTNKVLSMREANRFKGNRSPYEAFGDNPSDYDWIAISQRAEDLPDNKKWRFGPDAMERYENEERDFLARQLVDTQYIARLGKAYVESIFGGQGAPGQKRSVWVTPGRLTSDLRHFAGYNTVLPGHNSGVKDREDHRHHAVDGVVIAFTDPAMIKRAADQAKAQNGLEHWEMMKIMAEPLQALRDAVETRLKTIVISHKPDHGYQSAMHNDTAYGVTGEWKTKKEEQMLLVTRWPIEKFTTDKQLENIRDHHTKNYLLEAVTGLSGNDFKAALKSAADKMKPPLRRVRVVTPMKPTSYVTVGHGGNPTAKAYKGDGNYCYDIWMDDNDKWTGEIITTFEAYQMGRKDHDNHKKNTWWRKPFGRAGQKLVMRLRKGDMLELEHNGEARIVTVCKISPGKIAMADHFESNVDARTRSGYKGDRPLKYIFKAPSTLQKSKAVRVTVSPAGKVRRHI